MKITILSQSKISNEIKKIRKSQEEDFVKVNKIVSNIIKSIRKDGDRALLSYTKKFDKIELTLKELKLNKEIIKNSESQLPAALKKAMKLAIKKS